jgi:uncharacterized membrane protein
MPLVWAPDRPVTRLVAAAALPAAILLVWGLAHLLPYIDPRGGNYARFEDTFWRLVNAGCAFLAVLHGLTLARVLGSPLIAYEQLVLAAAGATVVIGGNYITRVQPNWFVGIRTPWTLSSDAVWRKTHRLTGRLLVLAGCVVVVLSYAAPLPVLPTVSVVFAITVAVSLVYSFILWRREQLASAPAPGETSA